MELQVDGLGGLQEDLRVQVRAFGVNTAVEVSFGTNYGVFVHEDLEAHHDTGEAKFLEKGAVQSEQQVAEYVERMIQSTNFGLALYGGGLIIQRTAMALTPVDTGALRASARTEKIDAGTLTQPE